MTKKISIQLGNGRTRFIKPRDIIFITRNDRRTEIHTTQGIYRTNESLQKLENQLNGENFFRCHKGYIINPEWVMEFAPYGNKTYLVKFETTKNTALITLEKAKEFYQKYCVVQRT